ncbi:MAG TPA: DUF4412 domain-containing protein [Thermoanaerobaculia bacterium]|nr:DUF4412 domain-containing protein [Thermoanaerobaculia bacterium]
MIALGSSGRRPAGGSAAEAHALRAFAQSIVSAALAAAAAAPVCAGVHYKAVSRTSLSGTEDAPPRSELVQVEAWVAGDRCRVDVLESDNPAAKAGTYLLTRDGGKDLYVVDPKEKTYGRWDLAAMLGRSGGVLHTMGPLLQVDFSDLKVEKVGEEDGGMVAGLPTRHYRYRTHYNTNVKVLGMGSTATTVIQEDVWMTDKLRDPGLGVWLRTDLLRTGSDRLDRLIAHRMATPPGYPLKVSTLSTNRQKDGKTTATRSSLEVIELDPTSPPDSQFEIPAGFQEKKVSPEGEKATPGLSGR